MPPPHDGSANAGFVTLRGIYPSVECHDRDEIDVQPDVILRRYCMACRDYQATRGGESLHGPQTPLARYPRPVPRCRLRCTPAIMRAL
jgi:hypothetical protein